MRRSTAHRICAVSMASVLSFTLAACPSSSDQDDVEREHEAPENEGGSENEGGIENEGGGENEPDENEKVNKADNPNDEESENEHDENEGGQSGTGEP